MSGRIGRSGWLRGRRSIERAIELVCLSQRNDSCQEEMKSFSCIVLSPSLSMFPFFELLYYKTHKYILPVELDALRVLRPKVSDRVPSATEW